MVRRETVVVGEINTAFENHILTGAIINTDYIKPRQFLEDAGCAMLERVRNVIDTHNGVKVNTSTVNL